jgi:hypothetical protein
MGVGHVWRRGVLSTPLIGGACQGFEGKRKRVKSKTSDDLTRTKLARALGFKIARQG